MNLRELKAGVGRPTVVAGEWEYILLSGTRWVYAPGAAIQRPQPPRPPQPR